MNNVGLILAKLERRYYSEHSPTIIDEPPNTMQRKGAGMFQIGLQRQLNSEGSFFNTSSDGEVLIKSRIGKFNCWIFFLLQQKISRSI